MRLLIVDDSRIVRERLSLLLSQVENVEIIGYADTVQKAINMARELKPDLVVLDIKIPGGSGIDVLESIRNGDHEPTVMMLTNYPYPQYEKKCMAVGAEFFFDKSADFERAVDVIRSLASLSKPRSGPSEEVPE